MLVIYKNIIADEHLVVFCHFHLLSAGLDGEKFSKNSRRNSNDFVLCRLSSVTKQWHVWYQWSVFVLYLKNLMTTLIVPVRLRACATAFKSLTNSLSLCAAQSTRAALGCRFRIFAWTQNSFPAIAEQPSYPCSNNFDISRRNLLHWPKISSAIADAATNPRNSSRSVSVTWGFNRTYTCWQLFIFRYSSSFIGWYGETCGCVCCRNNIWS